jgi:hypothetical protein
LGSNPTVTAILGRIDFLLRLFRSGSFLLGPARSFSDVGTAVVRGFLSWRAQWERSCCAGRRRTQTAREGPRWTSHSLRKAQCPHFAHRISRGYRAHSRRRMVGLSPGTTGGADVPLLLKIKGGRSRRVLRVPRACPRWGTQVCSAVRTTVTRSTEHTGPSCGCRRSARSCPRAISGNGCNRRLGGLDRRRSPCSQSPLNPA